MKTFGLDGSIKESNGEQVKPIVPDKRIDDQLAKPSKYEITEKSTFDVKFYLVDVEGRWLPYDSRMEKVEGSEEHCVTFRMWKFLEAIDLQRKSTSFDPTKRIHYTDQDLLNRLKIQSLLKEWSFEKFDPKLKLLHVNGVLVDESYNKFINLHPNIVRYVVDRMNLVLEHNG